MNHYFYSLLSNLTHLIPRLQDLKMAFLNPNSFQICHFYVRNLLNLQLCKKLYLILSEKKAMEAEFQALMKNNTWDLVPYTKDMNVVRNKWALW